MLPALQTLAQIVTERLLNSAAKGLVLAGITWLLLRFVGRQNSGTRFAIWFASLGAIAALPLFSNHTVMPAFLHPFPTGELGRQLVLPSSLALVLFTAWAVVAALLTLRLAAGVWQLCRFRNNCIDLDCSTLDPEMAGMLRAFKSSRRVRICVSTSAAVPAAIGFFRPAIVFPEWLLPQLSSEELEIILLHEAAHLRRWDDWTNLAQKFVKAVFFFHPAVWWIEGQLTLEREMACDDMVLAGASSPHAYASSLISFAEKLQGSRGLNLAHALVSRMQQMSLRVAQILDEQRPRRVGLRKPLLGVSIAMLALLLGTAPYAPQIVAFRSQPALGTRQAAEPVTSQMSHAAAQSSPLPAVLATERSAGHRGTSRSARAIPASFHPNPVTGTVLHLNVVSPRRPRVTRTGIHEQANSPQETILILRTTHEDLFRSGVWTLCIWTVQGSSADKQFQSAVFVSLI